MGLGSNIQGNSSFITVQINTQKDLCCRFGVSIYNYGHRVFLPRLDSDITKITRHMCGPRESTQHRCVRYWSSQMHFVPQLNSPLTFFFLFLSLQVTFSEEDMPRDDCEYTLGYYSNNMNSIVGLSTPIQVTKRQRTKSCKLTPSYDIFMNGSTLLGQKSHIWLLSISF